MTRSVLLLHELTSVKVDENSWEWILFQRNLWELFVCEISSKCRVCFSTLDMFALLHTGLSGSRTSLVLLTANSRWEGLKIDVATSELTVCVYRERTSQTSYSAALKRQRKKRTTLSRRSRNDRHPTRKDTGNFHFQISSKGKLSSIQHQVKICRAEKGWKLQKSFSRSN